VFDWVVRIAMWVRRMISNKTKLAAVLLVLLGLVFGFCGVVLRLPRLIFDLIMLLTMILMLLWTVGKRRVNDKDEEAEGR